MKNLFALIIGVFVAFVVINYFSHPSTSDSTTQSSPIAEREAILDEYQFVQVLKQEKSPDYIELKNLAGQGLSPTDYQLTLDNNLARIYRNMLWGYDAYNSFKVSDEIIFAWLDAHLAEMRDIYYANKCDILKQNHIDPKLLRLIFTPSTQNKMRNVWKTALQNPNSSSPRHSPNTNDLETINTIEKDIYDKTGLHTIKPKDSQNCKNNIKAIEMISQIPDKNIKKTLFIQYFFNYYSKDNQFIY